MIFRTLNKVILLLHHGNNDIKGIFSGFLYFEFFVNTFVILRG